MAEAENPERYTLQDPKLDEDLAAAVSTLRMVSIGDDATGWTTLMAHLTAKDETEPQRAITYPGGSTVDEGLMMELDTVPSFNSPARLQATVTASVTPDWRPTLPAPAAGQDSGSVALVSASSGNLDHSVMLPCPSR